MVDVAAAYRVNQIYKYDGYPGKKIWQKKGNESSYYDYQTDMQCKIPIDSKEEIEKRRNALDD